MRLRLLGVTLLLSVGTFALVPAALGQAQTKPYTVGWVSAWPFEPEGNPSLAAKAFAARWVELGYVDGKNVVWEVRSAEGKLDRLPALAAEVVATRPDVILATVCGAELNAMRRATSTIPIVVSTCTDDMVASGIVTSLARPGGNVTGQQKLTPELSAKRLELLKQVLPGASRVAVLWNPDYSPLTADWRALRDAAETLKVTLLPFEARSPSEYAPAFAAMAAQRVDAVYTFSDRMSYLNVQALAELVASTVCPTSGPTERAHSPAA